MTNKTAAELRHDTIWRDGPAYLMANGMREDAARGFLGMLMGEFDHAEIREVLRRCINGKTPIVDPRSYITKVLQRRKAEATAHDVKGMSPDRLARKIAHVERLAENRPPSSHSHRLLSELRAEWARRGYQEGKANV